MTSTNHPPSADGPEPGRTIGVEEEFLLVDPVTRRSTPRAAQVLTRAAKEPLPDGTSLQREMLAGQIEAASGVCTELSGIEAQLTANRRVLAAAARAEGARLVSAGMPVLDGRVPYTADARYRRIGRAYAAALDDYQTCGCHVHIGVPDRDTAVAVANHLRPWLPTLLALSANSPFNRGHDSGYGSWRALELARLPGAGIPPWFGSATEFDAQTERLVDCGVLMDRAMTFWLVRPSSHVPTVEVRAPDALGTVREAVLQAALVRSLVRTALADLAEGREALHGGTQQAAAAALWSAARYGLDGPGVDLLRERPVPARALLAELLDRVTPALEDTGDLAYVRTTLDWLGEHGSGATRQRRAAADGGPRAAVDMLTTQTPPPA